MARTAVTLCTMLAQGMLAACQAAGGWPYTLSPYDSGLSIEDVWPSLFFGRERLAEIKRKVATLGWARQALEQMVQEAELALQTEPAQPVERVGWRHDFYSRQSGEHLLYDSASPDSFLDPLTGECETLPEQHRAWVLLTHERTHRLMRSLGLLYNLTGDERYARWVAEGMRRAADMFAHRELREGNNTEALYFQPLYDAPALMMLADAYDLTRQSSAYTATDHETVRRSVFEEGIPYQLRFLDKTGTHNMTCFVAAAVARVGLLLGREDWVRRGLGDRGEVLAKLLREGVPETAQGEVDGFWFEGTMFYHFYSLCPLVALMEMDRARAKQGWNDPEVRRRFEGMFQAPMRLADQSLRLPVLGDLGAPRVMNLGLYRHLYEYAAGQLDDGSFGPTLAAIYQGGPDRSSWAALAYGPDQLPEARLPQGHDLLPHAGVAVFRGPGDWHVLFRVGPHGAGHDHPDKLEVALHACGKVIAPDVGTAGYALKDIHAFYRSTFSHSTLFVDEASQKPTHETSLVWHPEAVPPCARGELRDAYPGITLVRKVWFDPPYLVLADECCGETEHRYGWLWHAYGQMSAGWQEAVPAQQPLPAVRGLEQWLTGTRRGWVKGPLWAEWALPEGLRLRLVATSDGALEALVGTTPGNPMPDRRGTVCLRAPGPSRRFWAVLEVTEDEGTVAGLQPGEGGVVVALRDGSTRRYTVPS